MIALLVSPAVGQSGDDERHSRVIAWPASEAEHALIRSLDIDHVHGQGDGLRLVLTHSDVERLRRGGVRFEIEVAELERHYEMRALRDLEQMRERPRSSLHSPRNFGLGSVGGYYSIAELGTHLSKMGELFPQLAGSVETIGTTHQGRPIHAIRISARSAGDTTVPEALFTALHHPREPAGMMSVVYSMWTMLEGYGTDPEITWLLDNRALWFVPMVNPDGYQHNVQRYPNGGGLWRKNMRSNGDTGVDLNRNYGPEEFWSHAIGGSSVNVLAETYRGPGPFSEPETRAVRDFVLRRRFAVALNHHTFSNLFIQPDEIILPDAADSVYFRTTTRALASLAGFAPGNSRITVGYTARGTAEDWLYAFGRGSDGHTFAWTPESGNGEDEFWPAPLRIEPICAASHRMNMGIAWAAGAAPIITARTWRPDTAGAIVRVTVTNIGRATMTSAATLALDGGVPLSVPPLAPSEALTFELPVPDSLAGRPSAPRTMIGITLGYEGARILDSIAPIVHPIQYAFTERFESGMGRWHTGAAWGLETTVEHTSVASDSPGGNYEERREANALTVREPISLVGFTAADLFFDASYAVEGRNHTAFVQVLREGGIEWRDADCDELQLPFESASPIRNRFRGDMREWRRYRVNLDEYLGSEISVRFVVEAYNSQWHYTFDGIRIDDIEVVGARPIVTSAPDVSMHGVALTVSPNPFDATLAVELSGYTGPATLELHNELGEVVRTATVDARATLATEGLPAGVYTVVVRSGDEVLRRRVVLQR